MRLFVIALLLVPMLVQAGALSPVDKAILDHYYLQLIEGLSISNAVLITSNAFVAADSTLSNNIFKTHFDGPGTTGVVDSAIGDATNYLRGDGTFQNPSTNSHIRLTPRSAAPAASLGGMYFDSDDKHYYVCTNGSTWVILK